MEFRNFNFNSDPLVGLVFTTTFALFFLKNEGKIRSRKLKFRYLYRVLRDPKMRVLERHILDRFRLRFFFQNLRIALLLFWMLLLKSILSFLPEQRETEQEQFLPV